MILVRREVVVNVGYVVRWCGMHKGLILRQSENDAGQLEPLVHMPLHLRETICHRKQQQNGDQQVFIHDVFHNGLYFNSKGDDQYRASMLISLIFNKMDGITYFLKRMICGQ